MSLGRETKKAFDYHLVKALNEIGYALDLLEDDEAAPFWVDLTNAEAYLKAVRNTLYRR